MLPKEKSTAQLGFYSTFEEQLNHSHPLYKLSNQINWIVFDEAFKKHYSPSQGRPGKPIRLMVSLLILKQLRNLSDESVVEQWSENAYYQYFSGEKVFSSKQPCVPTELVEFRKRIGESGVACEINDAIPSFSNLTLQSISFAPQSMNTTFSKSVNLISRYGITITDVCQMLDISEYQNLNILYPSVSHGQFHLTTMKKGILNIFNCLGVKE